MSHVTKSALEELKIDRAQPRKGGRSWIWLVLLVFIIAAGWLVFQQRTQAVVVSTEPVIEEAATPDGAGGTVTTTVLNASGYVTARRQATVSSKSTGKIVEVLIEEGMEVQEGQLLARLDRTNLETSFRLAEAQLESARAALTETRVRLDEARRESVRVQSLARQKIASESEQDAAEAQVKSFEARLAAQEAEARVAERQVALYRQQLDDLEIRAPFAGIVVAKNAQPGEMISPLSAGGAFTRTGICTIVDMTSREIEVDVNEAFINRVQAGQPVTATLDAYPDWTIPCKVIATIPTADRQKATVKVRIGFDQLDTRILPEMGIKVAFQESAGSVSAGRTASTARRLIIPKAALRSNNGADVVFVFQDGLASQRAIKVGGRDGDRVIVQSGLAAGERVITQAPGNLGDGQKVRETKS